MKTYEIIQTTTGHSFGFYKSDSPAGAIAAMLDDAECTDDPDPGIVAIEVLGVIPPQNGAGYAFSDELFPYDGDHAF